MKRFHSLYAGSMALLVSLQAYADWRYIESSQGLEKPEWQQGFTELELADINADGHLDIVSLGDHGNPLIDTTLHGVLVYFGDGKGNWSLTQTGDFGYGGIAVGDVNNDGLLDIGYGIHHPNDSKTPLGDQILEVALGDGSGRNWQPWDRGLAAHGEKWGMFAVDFADVDNDGRLDLGANAFGADSGIRVYRNNGDGSWTYYFGVMKGQAGFHTYFGDVNGDGNSDLVVAYSLGTVWQGDGKGGFVNIDANLPTDRTNRLRGVAIGDIDVDGRDEIAFVLEQGKLQVWDYEGSQWADRSGELPKQSPYQMLQIADMNTDGFPDLVALGKGQLAIWQGDGKGNWQLATEWTIDSGALATALRAGYDIDHNGRPDIALLQTSSGKNVNTLRVFREASTPAALSAFLAYPRGREVWQAGSVKRIDWFAAVPQNAKATAKIELSTSGPEGPWQTLKDNAPNAGQQQIQTPAGTASEACFIRVTLSTENATVTAQNPVPFTIAR